MCATPDDIAQRLRFSRLRFGLDAKLRLYVEVQSASRSANIAAGTIVRDTQTEVFPYRGASQLQLSFIRTFLRKSATARAILFNLRASGPARCGIGQQWSAAVRIFARSA